MIPFGVAGGCQISLTDVVLTSGNRMPMGGPGTAGDRGGKADREGAAQPQAKFSSSRAAQRGQGSQGSVQLSGCGAVFQAWHWVRSQGWEK
jgi:hypothetical protein